MTRMHMIEDAARLAMGGVLAGDGPAEAATSRGGSWIPGVAIVLIGFAAALAAADLF